MRQFRKK